MRLYIIAGAGIALLAGLGVSHYQAYRAGRAVEQSTFIDKINRENIDAGNSAEKWRSDFRRCNRLGGVYDFETGTCDR